MIRFFDIFLSGLTLIILSPLLLCISLILRFTGEREVLYLQKRVGVNGKPFRLFKFATMLKNSPKIGTQSLTVKDDPRVLPFGKILRKTKINELPQLINVFKSDLSLIGPRPLTRSHFNLYSAEVKFALRETKPGLSGIGSIAFRDEELLLSDEKSAKSVYKNQIAPFKGELELWFTKNRTFPNYLKLIFATIIVVCGVKPKILWILYSDLPDPPPDLKRVLF